ncbi:MAG: rhomboid family intramembrane serine protease [Corynebacterium sp.]|nr:rhomboid family intramembrane serine protease [Corynebacterium sp.]
MSLWIRNAQRQAPMTLLLCASMLAVFIITALQSGSIMYNVDGSELAEAWILYGPAIVESRWGFLRILGTAFLHIGPVHLAMNLIMLFLFGRELEQVLGRGTFLAAFFTGAVGASSAIIFFTPLAPTAGVSGVVFAFMALYAGVALEQKRELRGLLTLIAVNIGFTVLWSEWISVWGHFGGLAIGIVLAIVNLIVRQKGVRIVAYFVVCAMCLLVDYSVLTGLSTGSLVFTTL